MATCKDCVHFDVCCSYLSTAYNKCKLATPDFKLLKNIECDECQHFKDRSRFVELPIIDDYGEAKLLDIAIDYCYKVAMSSDPNICVEYKAEHMRLCGWLGDLRRRIEAEQALKEREWNVLS